MTDVQNDLEGEVWGDFPGYEGYYQVSNKARIRTVSRYVEYMNFLTGRLNQKFYQGQIITTHIDKDGYMVFKLNRFGKRKTMGVHRAVALVFIDNPNNKSTVNHIDGNKLNNSLDNLEWVTNQENSQHAYDIGLITVDHNKKLTDEQVLEIYNKRKEGRTLISLAKEYNGSPSNMSRICLGRSRWEATGLPKSPLKRKTRKNNANKHEESSIQT